MAWPRNAYIQGNAGYGILNATCKPYTCTPGPGAGCKACKSQMSMCLACHEFFFCHESVEMCWNSRNEPIQIFQICFKAGLKSQIKTFTPLFMFQTVHDIFQDWLQSMCGLQRWIHLDLGVRLSVGFRELGFQHQGGSPLVPGGQQAAVSYKMAGCQVACKIKQE